MNATRSVSRRSAEQAARFAAAAGRAPVIAFRSSTDFHVSVSHDVPHDIAREVGAVVRRVMHHIAGVWSVTVERSPDRGRWRVELRGPTGRHSWTFLGAPEKLPAVIGQKLGTFIRVATVQHHARVPAAANRLFE